MRLGINIKLLFIILFIASIIIVSLSIVGLQIFKKSIEAEAQSKLTGHAMHTIEKLDRFMFERLSDVTLIAHQIEFLYFAGDYKNEEIDGYLLAIEKEKKVYSVISVYDMEGNKIVDTRQLGIGKNEKEEPFFKEAAMGNSYRDPIPEFSENLGFPIIRFSRPIVNGSNQVVRVLMVSFPIAGINNIVKGALGEELTEYRVDLVDENGLLLFSNHDRGGVLKSSIANISIFKKIKSSANKAETAISEDIRETDGDEDIFVAARQKGYLDYTGDDWILVIALETDGIYSPLQSFARNSILIGILLITLIAPISIFLSRTITNPIKKLAYVSSAIGGGNFEAKITVKTDDEIGDLAKSIERMGGELKESSKKIARHSMELESEVREKTKKLEQKIDEAEMMKKATTNIMEDIEETNKQLIDTQNQLKRNLEELKKLDFQKDQFISIAAHELKTPLTSIKGFADLLNKPNIGENPELRKKYLNIIYNDTKRLGNLIQNILELSRMDLGTMKIAREEIDIYKLIDDVKDQMDIIIKNKGLESEYNIEQSLPKISMDKDKLIQVISNLINNAVHYTEKGKISIVARKLGENVLFSVSDTGVGIPREHWDKIFTRFYQVDSPLTRKIGGSGLGLSLSKGFVEGMGGRMWFESEVGKGATFNFTLPIKISEVKSKEEIDLFKSEEKVKKFFGV